MNVDRLLNFHQSYTLQGVHDLNTRILSIQYAQSSQIAGLQDQMKTANSILTQILQNQIDELKYQGQQRYYKSLIYNINEAVDLISAEKDLSVKSYLVALFGDALQLNVHDAKKTLEEISDKEYCKALENKIQALYTLVDETSDENCIRLSASRGKYFDLCERREYKMRELEKYKSEVINLPPYVKKKRRGCLVAFLVYLVLTSFIGIFVATGFDRMVCIGMFVLLLIPLLVPEVKEWKEKSRRKKYIISWNSMHDMAVNHAQQDCDSLKKQIDSSEFQSVMDKISVEYPDWEEKVMALYSYIPNYEVK